MASYDVNNFVGTPVIGDVNIKIYDKFGKLKYTIDPNIAFFYKSANLLLIKVKDSNDIVLDFETSTDCNNALIKLNDVKQTIINMINASGTTNTKTNIFSKSNLNMNANKTINDGDLACENGILDIPVINSTVKVFVNGVEVNVGGKTYPYDCYFSNDGVTVRNIGDERLGDKLYWNGSISGYELDETDLIDFMYLINIS